jgi:hypothetical protein
MNSLQSTVRAHTTMAPTPHSNRRREHFSIQFGENTHTSYIFCALQLSQFFLFSPSYITTFATLKNQNTKKWNI